MGNANSQNMVARKSMIARTKTSFCAAMILCSALPAFAQRTYFEENFRNYCDKAPGVVEDNGICVDNEPIWDWAYGAKLCVRAERNGLVYKDSIPAPGLVKFDLNFRFAFLNNTPGIFSLVLSDASGRTTNIDFSKEGVADVKFLLPLGNWQFEEAYLKADGAKIAVYVTETREFKKLCEVPFPNKLAGINFKAFAGVEFAVSNILLSDPAPMKAFRVEEHFAAMKSLNRKSGGPLSVEAGAVVDLNPGPVGRMFGIRMKLTPAGGPEVTLQWSNGEKDVWKISAGSYSDTLMAPVAGMKKGEKFEFTDAVVDIGRFARQYVRPWVKRYCSSYDCEAAYLDIVREWQKLPKASEHQLDLAFRPLADGQVEVYVDGSYVKNLSKPLTPVASKAAQEKVALAKLSRVAVKFPAKTTCQVKPPANSDPKYTVIDLASNPRAKTFVDSHVSLTPGLQAVQGVPMNVVDGNDSADVGICKQGKGNWALEVDEYLARSPLDGFPSAIHFRLPAAPYIKAHILCAIDPSPAKDACLTTRLGYYINNGSGGNMLSDTDIRLENGKVPESFAQVGEIALRGEKVPLYFVTIPLNAGAVLDILARRDYVDFEFIGKKWENFQQLNRDMTPDPFSDSAFNIFAVTLEKSPVVMDMKPVAYSNVFTADEPDKRTAVALTAVAPAKGSVSWKAAGIDGKELFHGSRNYSFARAGETAEIAIPLTADPGFYDLAIALHDAAGKTLLTHNARFAVVPKDTRKVDKYKSPYATWWFANSHGSIGDLDHGGTLMRKAGIRKASWVKLTPEAEAQYNITNDLNLMFPGGLRDFDATTGEFKPQQVADPNDQKKKIAISGEEAITRKLADLIKNNPKADHCLIWHESAPGYGIPEELLNLPVPNDETTLKRAKLHAAYINACGKIIRKFPQLKIQIGNSSASIGAATLPLRGGADPKYYDYIGIETPSQCVVPEKLQEVGLQGLVVSTEIASTLAKRKVRANGTWEFTYRCERDMGEQQQAQWYVRDVLISLANDFFLISPGIFFDCSTGYYNGLWGGSGIITRGPYAYPKRAYVAYAVLTSVLDGVKFSRQLDAGSTTVYAVEFTRLDGRYVTAFWTARGDVVLDVVCPAGRGELTAMYGSTATLNGPSFQVASGTSPVYLVTDKPLTSVTIARRSFPKGEAIARSGNEVKIESADQVDVRPDPTIESTHTNFLPILKPADFTVTSAVDEEVGKCIEVVLDANDKYKSKYVTAYTTVRFKEPIPLPGQPEVIWARVKGNSNWGQIRFEIEDARGEVFKNLSTGRSWACDIMDWPGNLCVNFDGWGVVYQTLAKTSLVNDHSPGPYSDQWVSEGGDKVIQFPIKVRAITVGVNRQKLDLLDFKKSAPAIRISAVGATGTGLSRDSGEAPLRGNSKKTKT
jgi:hypothetical protein